jgi:DNA-directed RNA polymerase subunit F
VRNTEIRHEIAAAGLRHWQVAEKFGLNDGNFSRKLRHELSDEEKAKIRAIIADLSKEVQE